MYRAYKLSERLFLVRTALSWHPNVYNYKFPLDGMRIDVIRYEPHTLIFEAFQILFLTASLIFTAAKLFHQVI